MSRKPAPAPVPTWPHTFLRGGIGRDVPHKLCPAPKLPRGHTPKHCAPPAEHQGQAGGCFCSQTQDSLGGKGQKGPVCPPLKNEVAPVPRKFKYWHYWNNKQIKIHVIPYTSHASNYKRNLHLLIKGEQTCNSKTPEYSQHLSYLTRWPGQLHFHFYSTV